MTEDDGTSSGRTESRLKLTEDLLAAQKVDGSLQKLSRPHGKLMGVDRMLPNRTDS